MYNQLRGLQKKAKDLRTEVRNLRRLSQAQAHSVRESIRDTFIKIRAMLLASGEQVWQAGKYCFERFLNMNATWIFFNIHSFSWYKGY